MSLMVPRVYITVLLCQRLFTIHPEDEYLPVGGVKKYICYDMKMSYKSFFEFVFICSLFVIWIHCALFWNFRFSVHLSLVLPNLRPNYLD